MTSMRYIRAAGRTCALAWLFVIGSWTILLAACHDQSDLLTTKPAEVISFQIVDEHQNLIWRFESVVGPVPLKRITYGEVPDGCRQTFPEGDARPRPFVE